MIQLVEAEKKIFSCQFPAYGSLYYTLDVAEASRVIIPELDRFCIGPIAKRQFWFDERKDMDLYRGACKLKILAKPSSVHATNAVPRGGT
jgi:hypothetical protein